MVAKELMRREVFTIQDDDAADQLIDLLVREHIHGCPVLDAAGKLVGVVTQQDVFLGGRPAGRRGVLESPSPT